MSQARYLSLLCTFSNEPSAVGLHGVTHLHCSPDSSRPVSIPDSESRKSRFADRQQPEADPITYELLDDYSPLPPLDLGDRRIPVSSMVVPSCRASDPCPLRLASRKKIAKHWAEGERAVEWGGEALHDGYSMESPREGMCRMLIGWRDGGGCVWERRLAEYLSRYRSDSNTTDSISPWPPLWLGLCGFRRRRHVHLTQYHLT